MSLSSIRSLVLVTITLFAFCVPAHSQGWLWSNWGQGSANSYGQAVATDKWGNVYVTGAFFGETDTLIFGTKRVVSAGDENLYLVKYDQNGNVVWAKQYGGMYSDYATAVTTDTFGNVYLTGSFTSAQLRFDTVIIKNYFQDFVEGGASTLDGFLVKLDSGGHAFWAKDIGGMGSESNNSVSVNKQGEVFVCGSFNSDTLMFGTDMVFCAGANDIFICKYDNSGNLVWHAQAGGTQSESGTAVGADTFGNVYMTGGFASTTIGFGAYELTKTDSISHIFIAKYNNAGVAQWATSIGGNSLNYTTAIVADNPGNIYVTGAFSGGKVFFGSDSLVSSSSFSSMFFAKYTDAGNVLWLSGCNTAANVTPQSLCVDQGGNLYISGYFSSATATFGPFTLVNTGTVGYADIFLAKYNNAGSAIWATGVGAATDDVSNSVAADQSGNVFIAGYTTNPYLTFGLFSDSCNLTEYMYVAKFNETKMAVPMVEDIASKLYIYPNPASDVLHIDLPSSDFTHVSVLNMLGNVVREVTLQPGENSLDLSIAGIPSAVYVLRAVNKNGATAAARFTIMQ